MRGIGWTTLYQDPASGQLMNMWIAEHDGGHPAGGTLLMIMDVFEHAFMLDYGLKRADYIEAFFKAIDWSVVAAPLRRGAEARAEGVLPSLNLTAGGLSGPPGSFAPTAPATSRPYRRA